MRKICTSGYVRGRGSIPLLSIRTLVHGDVYCETKKICYQAPLVEEYTEKVQISFES